MGEFERTETVVSEATILVNVILSDATSEDDPLDELQGLAETAGANVVGTLTQRRHSPDKTTYMGKGKVEELLTLVEARDADAVIFDNNLSPGQTRNLEKEIGVKVLDRTELILDIFASHAQTHESRLAVELAQLQYSLPRLKRMWTHLSRIRNGIGMRGPGEKQLEEDRRLVERRIRDLRRDLKEIERRKERQVESRSDRMTVSLVGYTNAGKSTVLNRLTDSSVKAEDRLFATLDTRTRRWQLPGWGPVLLSDTVGFIRDLPHQLIASFKATLSEARHADLLVHVADASNENCRAQIASVYGVLEEIGIEEKDTVLVLNKSDNVPHQSTLDSLQVSYPSAIVISAKTGHGMTQLGLAVSDALSRSFINCNITTSVGNGRLLAYLAAHGEVLSNLYEGEQVTVHCRIAEKHLGRIQQDGVLIVKHALDGEPVRENDDAGCP